MKSFDTIKGIELIQGQVYWVKYGEEYIFQLDKIVNTDIHALAQCRVKDDIQYSNNMFSSCFPRCLRDYDFRLATPSEIEMLAQKSGKMQIVPIESLYEIY